jgi:RNA polymerase sigma-70 factor (ECF subfamily)
MRSKVSTWIFGIAYRQAMKAIRLLDEPVDCDFEQIPDEDACAPEQACMQRQLQHAMANALDMLSADQRVAVKLTYYHGFRYGEIAETMACPVNTVKTRMFNARRQLKSALSQFMGPA